MSAPGQWARVLGTGLLNQRGGGMMGSAVVADRWAYNGHPAVVLENHRIRAVVLPTIGGKLYMLEDRLRAREWLWQNPRILPAPVLVGSTLDEHWSGGADVFFPTCYPCEVDGVRIPDAGEWWNVPWQQAVHRSDTGVTLELQTGGRILPVEARRLYVLEQEGRSLRLEFRILNVGHTGLSFVLGFHPALAVRPGGRMLLPAGVAQVDETSHETMGALGQRYRWPALEIPDGETIDMSVFRGSDAAVYGAHFLFPDDKRVRWSVVDPDGSTLNLVASEAFQGLWLWQVYGGWRGYHHVAIEPWTSYPITLSRAIEVGTAITIGPREEFMASVTLSVGP